MPWVKAKLDLAALARLRWIERWSIDRLAEHFGMSGTNVKRHIQAIRRNSRMGGLSMTPLKMRGRRAAMMDQDSTRTIPHNPGHFSEIRVGDPKNHDWFEDLTQTKAFLKVNVVYK